VQRLGFRERGHHRGRLQAGDQSISFHADDYRYAVCPVGGADGEVDPGVAAQYLGIYGYGLIVAAMSQGLGVDGDLRRELGIDGKVRHVHHL
jgi:hypothetical protein